MIFRKNDSGRRSRVGCILLLVLLGAITVVRAQQQEATVNTANVGVDAAVANAAPEKECTLEGTDGNCVMSPEEEEVLEQDVIPTPPSSNEQDQHFENQTEQPVATGQANPTRNEDILPNKDEEEEDDYDEEDGEYDDEYDAEEYDEDGEEYDGYPGDGYDGYPGDGYDEGEYDDYDDDEEDDDGDYDEEDEEEEEEEDPPGSDFGVGQIVYAENVTNEVLWEYLESVEEYMYETVWEQEFYDKFPRTCWNQESMCTVWAYLGECIKNVRYMMENCKPACFACEDEQGHGSTFGSTQVLEDWEADDENEDLGPKVLEHLDETEKYLSDVVMVDDFYTKVRSLCYNRHERCTAWAVQGYCDVEEEKGYMHSMCGPACQTCEKLHYETRCPIDEEFPDIFQPGDINKMFERIVADDTLEVNVWSRPAYLEGDNEETADYKIGPWIITIDNFISDDLAARLIDHGTGRYERSEEVAGTDEETGEVLESVVSTARTSTNAWCNEGCDQDPNVVDLFYRIEQLTGVPQSHSESLQLLKYEPGQFYKTHHDYIDDSDVEQGGPRVLTVFCYLNDVEEGGETRFDFHGDMMVTARRGSVAIWPSVLDEDPSQIDDRTEHEAMPIIKGQKFGANAWLHLRNYTKAGENGC